MAVVNGQWVEQGVPGDYVNRGATTVAQYQQMAASDLSDRQIQAQRDIADQQAQLNERQFQAQQDQYAQQQAQVQEQAQRQTQYDTGRAQLLSEGTQQINDAFARFYRPVMQTLPATGGPPRAQPTPPTAPAFTYPGGKAGMELTPDQQAQQAAAQQYQADTQDWKSQVADPAHGAQISQQYSDYFDQFAHEYTARAQNEVTRQQNQAERDLAYALARQGLSASQAGVNQEGLIQETAGRTMAEQVDAAQNAAGQLRANVAQARQNLLTQLTAAESIGSPIAGGSPDQVNQALQTQRNAISGVTSAAGDVTSSLQAVPTPNSLGTIFGGVLGTAGSLIAGQNAGAARGQFGAGFAGTNPSTSSTRMFG